MAAGFVMGLKPSSKPKPWYRGPWRKVRLEVLERDGWRCQLRLPGCEVRADQADHIVRVRDGGAWFDIANLRAACGPCNRQRELEQRSVSAPPSREW